MTSFASANPTTPLEPAVTDQVIIERPPEGLARGQYAWPAWWVGSVGGLGVALGLYYLLRRRRRR